MESSALYALAADALLVAHALFVVLVVLGLILIFAGKFLSWRWVRNPWFRVTHLLGISVVVLQSWFGVICPLTAWEMQLRSKIGNDSLRGFLHNTLDKRAPILSSPALGVCGLLYGLWGAGVEQLVFGAARVLFGRISA